MSTVLRSVDGRGVATITLNRPEANNAYDGALIDELHRAMDELGGGGIRAVVLQGAGRHFQAGADQKWIQRVAAQSAEENERVSRATSPYRGSLVTSQPWTYARASWALSYSIFSKCGTSQIASVA